MNKVVLLGAGGFARELYRQILDNQIVSGQDQLEVIGFVAPQVPDKKLMPENTPVFETIQQAESGLNSEFGFIPAIGKPLLRMKAVKEALNAGLQAHSFIHHSAVLTGPAEIGEGVVVCAMSVITSDVHLGDYVQVNPSCNVAHDCVVGAWTSLYPGCKLNGKVRIGEECQIGSGAIILPEIKVADQAIVGAGSVVTRDVGFGRTVMGVPAQ